MSVSETFQQIVADLQLPGAPTKSISVSYPSGVNATLGNELTPINVKDRPTVEWEAEKDTLYTLLMTDPDTPIQIREVRHWLVVNVPGSKVDEGDTLVDYVGSGPPQGNGIHRYIFLIFKQQKRRVTNKIREGRLSTSTRALVEDYALGAPIFENFYRAQYDDYVPIWHRGSE